MSALIATVLLGALTAGVPNASRAQAAKPQPKVPIRAVSAPVATTPSPVRALGEGVARELPDGRLLVNAGLDRRLLVYDASLAHATVLADTAADAPVPYTFAPRVVPYLGDSTMLFDTQSRSLMLLGPTGVMGRVMATPTQNFNGFGPGGGVDSRGRLVYAQLGGQMAAAPCTPGVTPPRNPQADSGFIVRADFVTRTVDTIARNRGAIPGIPIIVRDPDCRITAVKWPFNPMLPSVDTWTMTSTGVLAIIRGFDYHMDFVYADGRRVSAPKMPFDWRRLTDADKQAKIDSARQVIDSISAAGGYRARTCGTNLAGLMMLPIPASVNGAAGGGAAGGDGGGRGGGASRGGGDAGRGGEPDANAMTDCKWIPMGAAFPALSDMPDYIPPIRQTVPKADVDGNVWILPTTSLAAKNGLLYDVVNPKGELVERVQLPADRDIFTFGRGGVLYLSRRDGNGIYIERVKILR
jgi:hypothetical protein